MKISLLDRSLYYKGLMLLCRKDGIIHDKEKDLLMYIGEKLGFDRRFCEDTLNEILDNKYIFDAPPHFSETCIAKCFIRDGLRLSLVDGQMHELELAWLKAVAEKNSLDGTWYGDVISAASDGALGALEDGLDADCLQWW